MIMGLGPALVQLAASLVHSLVGLAAGVGKPEIRG
jgi:hypothetical protein